MLSAKSRITQFLCSVIDSLEAVAHYFVVGVVFFDVRMRKGESVVEDVGFAEEQIFFSCDKFILNPFKTFKPNEFYRACLIGEGGAYACHTWLAVSLYVRYCPDKLIINGVVINLVYLMDFATVYITKREIF